MAKRLINQLGESDVKVEYLLSLKMTIWRENIPVYNINMDFPDVDLIIVVDTDKYLEVENLICSRKLIEVISIHELLYRVLKEDKRKKRYA